MPLKQGTFLPKWQHAMHDPQCQHIFHNAFQPFLSSKYIQMIEEVVPVAGCIAIGHDHTQQALQDSVADRLHKFS
jgi:hypothetical protein